MAFKGAKKRTRSMNNPANSLFLPTASTAIEALDRKDILRYLYVPLIVQRNSRLVELRTPSLSEYVFAYSTYVPLEKKSDLVASARSRDFPVF